MRELNARRKAAQPTNRRTFGSVFKNPEHELTAGRMLEACGLKGHRDRRRADLAQARELHRERGRGADRGRDRADGGGAAARPRAVRRRAAARGRVPRRARAAAARVGARPASGERGRVARRRRPAKARAPRARAASSRCRGEPLPALPRSLASLRRAARSRSASASSRSPPAPMPSRAQTSAFAISTLEVDGAPAAVQQQVRRALAPFLGTNLLALDGAALERRAEALPTVVSSRLRPRLPAHAPRSTSCPERTVAVLHRGKETWLVSARGRVSAHPDRHAPRARPDLGAAEGRRRSRRLPRRRGRRRGRAHARPRGALPGPSFDRLAHPRRARRSGCAPGSSSGSASRRTSGSSSRSRGGRSPGSRPARLRRRQRSGPPRRRDGQLSTLK